MGEKQHEFLRDQRNERQLICTTQVDKRWKKTMDHKNEKALNEEKRRKKDADDQAALIRDVQSASIEDDTESSDDHETDGYETGRLY